MKRIQATLSICVFLTLLVSTGFAQRPTKTESVLSSGTWYKLAVSEPGVYKINHALISEIGLSNQDAAGLRLFSNGGGPLRQVVGAQRIDDLEEIPSLRVGLSDGSFDANDYILFYTEGPDRREFHELDLAYRYTRNTYDLENHIFAGLPDGEPKVINERPDAQLQVEAYTDFDDYVRIEEDRFNLLGKYRKPGSGKRWFGDEFAAVREKSYTIEFPDIVIGREVEMSLQFAGRSGSFSTVYADVEGSTFSKVISSVNLGDVEDPYAKIVALGGSYLASGDDQQIRIRYPEVGGTTTSGWLDFIEMKATRHLRMANTPLFFRKFESVNQNDVAFELSNTVHGLMIWDITDPFNPIGQQYTGSGDAASFSFDNDGQMHEFVAFEAAMNLPVPGFAGEIANQNLHGVDRADLVIIYHRDFEQAVNNLATHRRNYNGYEVVTVPVDQIYNEFAGGSVDPTAIRDFAAMLKARDNNFRFMLLFGDGTYDVRHIQAEQEDDNFVPVYETDESMDPISAFPSDDYYALLDDTEGNDDLKGAIDIAVGRLPVGSAEEANEVVNKIIHYDNGPGTFGDWRLRSVFVGDDQDGNLHLNQSEIVSSSIEEENPVYNINKIYLDAYPQVSTSGGPRYPDVNAAINSSVQKGSLVINYFGHGGHQGWSQERVLGLADIQSWTNLDNLPVFITATCEFTGYDEPTYYSAGEEVILNPTGGASVLLTTVRAVYSSSNKRLTSAVFDHFFDVDENGNHLPLGEIIRIAKNSNAIDTIDINSRKFAIIGDPSMVVAYPEHTIAVTSINNSPVGNGPDTLKALQEVSIQGEVRSKNGPILSWFNGTAMVTVFDKKVIATTLANDPSSFKREFESLSRVIFRGNATVSDGKFSISFVVPLDIDYSYGNGKISMYATDHLTTDAAGYYTDIVIGGSADIVDVDDTGPKVDLFLNNRSFNSGDKVGPNPVLLVDLFDDVGISVIGSSIGHDLEAILDNGDSQQKYILNEFYQANQDDYTSGTAEYALSNLEPGKYTISVTAWDVAGNFTEESIDFYVESNPDDPVRSVINYPNPAGVETTFRIQHDLKISSADVGIQIFDVSGRLVGEITEFDAPSVNGVIDNIVWDRDCTSCSAFIGNITNGVYFYNVTLTTKQPSNQERRYTDNWGKLILVN